MISLNQLIAMAKVANGALSSVTPYLRKIWFNNGIAVATDTYILFEKTNCGVDVNTALNSEEITKKIKIKDNKAYPFLMIEHGQINSTPIKVEDHEYPEYELIIPEITEEARSVVIDKDLLEKLLTCFENHELEFTFTGNNKPIIIKHAGLGERGLIMPIKKNEKAKRT